MTARLGPSAVGEDVEGVAPPTEAPSAAVPPRRTEGRGASIIEQQSNGRWEHHAPALAVNVGPMRSGVVAFAAAHGAGSEAQADIALAVSEGLTNAVLHAFTTQAVGTMSLLARVATGVLHVSIADDGSGMIARTDSPGLGLGLTVIASITSQLELGLGPAGKGTEMRLTFDVPGLRAASQA